MSKRAQIKKEREKKLLFSWAPSEPISQQNLTLKILSGQMKHGFAHYSAGCS